MSDQVVVRGATLGFAPKLSEVGELLDSAQDTWAELEMVWYRARAMGGGVIMLYEEYNTLDECWQGCTKRRAELGTPVKFFPVMVAKEV